jgi:hypothetical protein
MFAGCYTIFLYILFIVHQVDLIAPSVLRINEFLSCAEHRFYIQQFRQLLINVFLQNGYRSHTKDPCVIFRGLTWNPGWLMRMDEGYRQEEQCTHLGKILLNNSTIQMNLALFQGPINFWWNSSIGFWLVSTVFDFSSSDHLRAMVLYQFFISILQWGQPFEKKTPNHKTRTHIVINI